VEDAFGQNVSFETAADQAASRLYGRIHYRSDNEDGLTLRAAALRTWSLCGRSRIPE
jgi:hypothetical protein